MTITQIQLDIQWADAAANRKRAEALLRQAPASDLYVLPEMWQTGFAVSPHDVAEDAADSESLRWMETMARQLNAAVTGTLCLRDGDGHFRNRCCFVTPEGILARYDKRHLFTYGGEHRDYSAGTERTVVEWRGVRLLLQICYDLRFPVFSRNRGDYDAIIYMASWPESRSRVWDALLTARAIENQCYVVAVNRVGSDPRCSYVGGTRLTDAYGRTVSECPAGQESFITNTIDTAALRAFREKFPVLSDSDSFSLL